MGSRAVRVWSVLLGAAMLGLTACGGPETSPAAHAPTTPSATPPAADAAVDLDHASFATSVSANGRYFVDQRGTPWFGLGDSAWSLFGELDRHEVDLYLDDRAARGFNLVLASVLENHYSDNPPDNANGDPPFVGKIFRSEPNEAYWQWVDYVVEAAQARGITLLLCPAYLGYEGSDDGLEDEVTDATDAQMAAYGQFLADRYGAFPNVMWLIGHDRVPDATAKSREEALAGALPADDLLGVGAASTGLQIPQWQPTSMSIDFETVYSYDAQPVVDIGAAWEATPTRPVLFLEGRYEQEEEAGIGSPLLRLQTYGVFGSGAAAVFFGNNPIWHFESVALHDFEGTWQENLRSLGSQDAQRFGEVVRSTAWWDTTPDLAGRLVVQGQGAGGDQALVRLSGTQAFVYLPTRRPTTLDLSVLADADRVQVSRVDPRSGQSVPVGTYDPAEPVTLPDPGANAAGDDDWVYLLTGG